MVTHEQPGTSFWDRVRAGAEQAAKNDNVEVKYSGDPQQATQATQVQNAIDSKVDGIAATLAAPEGVGPVLQQAFDAGIPTVAFNAGIDTYQQYGALMYFGSDESIAVRPSANAALRRAARRRSASCTPRACPPWRPAAPG
jgi:simple sugar transport system substrate-binding protein